MALVIQLLDIYSWIIIASALISWFPISQDHPLVRLLHTVTEPVFAPIRQVVSPDKTGGIDLSPILVLFAIQLIQSTLARSMY